MKKILLALGLVAVTFVACKKEETPATDAGKKVDAATADATKKVDAAKADASKKVEELKKTEVPAIPATK